MPSPVDDGAVVLLLAADVEQLTRFAGGGAEMAVVEQDHREAGPDELLGVGGQTVVSGGREAVCHDHTRHRGARVGGHMVGGHIEVCGESLAVRGDGDVVARRRHIGLLTAGLV